MNDKYSTTEGKTSEKLSDEAMLSAQWKSIDWHKAEREVNRLQIRIVKATQQKDYNAVKRLQYLLTHSFYAKALAVKRVVTNDGRRTPGVDGVLWNTPAKKMAAALSLTDKRYRARPLRRVYIEKKDKKKKRPLGIPTMYDRAMQALYALALEPVAETTADGKSFGFRKGRCAQDACEYLFNALSRKHISPKWVLEGDIKGCFDHIPVNEHFPGIGGKVFRVELGHFLLDQGPFFLRHRDAQHNVSCSVCHSFTVLSEQGFGAFPNKQPATARRDRGGPVFGSVATLPMLATFLLLRY